MNEERDPGGREYDVIVFGATGFTGGKTAEYLALHAPPGFRWAIAGRSREKLDAVKARLSARHPACANLGTVVASVDEPASLSKMTASTRVVLTTVGPFIDYGEPLVKACVEQGTDYVDSTGEPNFVNLLLARYAEPAARANVRLVPSCGFDSIPADLGAFYTLKHLPEGAPIRMSGYMKLKASFSGGTERSAIKSLAPSTDSMKPVRRVPSAGRKVTLVTEKVKNRPELGGWSSPLPTIDGAVVIRSATTIDRYGPDFSYAHNAIHASLFILWAAAWVFGSLALFVRVGFLREFFLRIVKKSGEGPSEEQMAQSWFKLRFIAESGGKTVQTEVSGGDPGYGETSKMLAESAMCLALDRASLPARSGVLTPAEAMGDVLLDRLQRAGLRFSVVS
jgi:short subunit dehydrogenase-like uncharacterized protein